MHVAGIRKAWRHECLQQACPTELVTGKEHVGAAEPNVHGLRGGFVRCMQYFIGTICIQRHNKAVTAEMLKHVDRSKAMIR
jgi:hypothetical protein